ncbi:MAG: hypothetical protein ACLGJB_13310 [Blastocatellia bacterium]
MSNENEMVLGLIERCGAAVRAGVTRDGALRRVLRDEVQRLVKEAPPRDFLEWVKEDREYSCYYYDAQQSGVCAKPAEIMAMILESIALDALE